MKVKLISLAVAGMLLSSVAQAVTIVPTGLVSITGGFTSFKAALSPYFPDGNGEINYGGNTYPLAVDPSAPVVYYSNNPEVYPQSTTVSLPQDTSSVSFNYPVTGVSNPNVASFTPTTETLVAKGDVFKVGTFTLTNGFWYPQAEIGFSITTHSAVAALDNHTFTGFLDFKVSNPSDPLLLTDPEAQADYFYLSDASGGALTSLGSVRIYEQSIQPASHPGNTGTVDLYAKIGSLIPMYFANPSSGAFLSTSLDPVLNTTPVPEPDTYAMMLAGLGVMGFSVRRIRAA